eukprot:GFKZ01011384.1.p1 GENE.GFKZ01011384.1~~GFKZ01011384.1.p1  ORF type:complete len:558 (-),score=81.96 GFKZ01011384.1:2661-4334(-)
MRSLIPLNDVSPSLTMAHRFSCFVSPSTAAPLYNQRRFLSQFHIPLLSSPPRLTSVSRSYPRMVTTEAPNQRQGKQNSKKPKSRSGKREKKSAISPGLARALEKYEPVIGMEFHVQLATSTKAFCKCSTKPTQTPNVNICPTCTGHPGALPVLNAKVVELAAKAGMALDCTISNYSQFDRKNYFYVDTPKNYQITQDLYPIAQNGSLQLPNSGKIIGITRLHMEEDSAKMSHEGTAASGRITDSTHSLIDFNRSGIPLIEIVSEPQIRSGAEAAEFGQELQRVLRHVGTSDCNMQDGSLRCDVNVSIRPKGTESFGTRVELKNLNSFSAAQKSVDFEIERQARLLEAGETLQVETRTWDEKTSETKTLRVKEAAADYRYFPEPDLPPLELSREQVDKWRAELPELPSEKRERYEREFGLSAYDAFLLTDDVAVARYFEAVIEAGGDAKQGANWIMGDMTKVLKYEKLDIGMCRLRPEGLAELIGLIEQEVISGKIAKDLIAELVTKGGGPAHIVEERDLKMISDPIAIKDAVARVLDENPTELAAFREVGYFGRWAD